MTIEEIVQACGNIPSTVFEPEQRLWFKYIKDLPGEPVIVDFGTGHGRSAASLALSCPQGVVFTFDTGEPYINVNQTPQEYEDETNKFILDTGAVNFVFSLESSLEKKWSLEIDVLNIDSNESYDSAKSEITKWVRYVKTGGLVFFHDYEHYKYDGVRKAIDELIPSTFKMELLEVADCGPVKCACFKKL